MKKIELSTERNSEGAWVVTAWVGDDYAGNTAFYGYTKTEAIKKARNIVKGQGGLGIYALQNVISQNA